MISDLKQSSVKAVVLVGLMGSGKSSVGAKVARSIGAQFVDTDDLIAQRTGRSVRDIFAQDGEAAFRDAEVSALTEAFSSALLGNDIVISTGGGIVLSPINRKEIKEGLKTDLDLSKLENIEKATGKLIEILDKIIYS